MHVYFCILSPPFRFLPYSLSFLLPSPRFFVSLSRLHVVKSPYCFEIFPNDLLFERENRLRFHTYVDSILKIYKSRSAQHRGGILYGGPRVCKLRRNFHSVMATRRYGPLPVQRVRSLPQDEWNEPTFGEAATAIGKEGRKKENKERRREGTEQLSNRVWSANFHWKRGHTLGVKAVFRFLFLCLSVSLSLSLSRNDFLSLSVATSNKETKKERKMKKKGKGDRSEEKSVDARAQRYARRVYRTTGAYVEIRPCPNWWRVNPCHIRDLAHIGT